MSPAAAAGRGRLRRKALGLWTGLALVVGNMVGAGAYLVPATLGPYGPISLAGWLATGAGAICLALVFARLGRLMPAEGGPYAYTRASMGDVPAFMVAWGYWVSVWVGNAAISTAFVGMLTPFFPELDASPALMATVALGAVWLLTAVNVWGLREAAILQLVTTVLKTLPLILFATVGLLWIEPANFTPVNVSGESTFSAITATALLTLWGLMGLESATIPADEVEDPEKTIPRATALGTVGATLIYVLSTVALMGVLLPHELAASSAPFADAAIRIWGPGAGMAVAAGAALAGFGVLNGWVIMQGQMPLAPARDGLFPRRFGRLSARGTPVFTLVLSSSLTTVLVTMNYTRGLVGLFEFALVLATITVLVPYAATAAAQVVLMLRDPARFGGPDAARALAVAVLAFGYSCWVIVGSGWEAMMWGAVLMVAGLPVYAWSVRRRPVGDALTVAGPGDE